MSTSIVPIGIVIQWCMTDDVVLHKRHPFISLILTMMADHHLSLPLLEVSNGFVCSASYSWCNSLDPSTTRCTEVQVPASLKIPLAVRCVAATFYSKPLQIQQNHDTQVDHIRASRPL